MYRKAIGVGSGSQVFPGSGLHKIDSDGAPVQVMSSDALVNILTANPVEGTPIALSVTKNGVAVPNIDVNDVISGPTGFSYGPIVLDGLDKTYGISTSITASLTMDVNNDGTGDVVFNAAATVTGTITNLAMTNVRRRLTEGNAGANEEMCHIIKSSRKYASSQQ